MAARGKGVTLSALFDALPRRFSRASLLKDFPRATSLRILERFAGADAAALLAPFFPAAAGFGGIARIDRTDGLRIHFANGDIAHIRPSGNADELRLYAVADTPARADEIVRLGVDGPDSILRKMEKST